MMIEKLLAFAAATAMAATPCLAAELPSFADSGVRRSAATAGVYFKVPLIGTRSEKARAGLRLSMTHDYRHAGAQTARVVEADALDLRLVGKGKPALLVAGREVTGDEAERTNFGPVSTVVTLAIIVAAAVGGYYIVRAIDDSGEE
jgi:hypothetical protein